MLPWASEATDLLTAGAPWWFVLVLVATNVVTPMVAAGLTYRAATKSTAATALTAKETLALASSKSDREILMAAIALTQSENERSQTQGWAMIEGLAAMPGLSQGDALLVQSVTRPQIEPTLSEGRRVEELDGKLVRFVLRIATGGSRRDGST